jgi:hypothetical protein
MPAALSALVAVRTSSTVVPLSIASRIRCEPDSTPIQTSSHPASASARATVGETRSARHWIMNGMRASRARISSASAVIHRALRPNRSSANQT